MPPCLKYHVIGNPLYRVKITVPACLSHYVILLCLLFVLFCTYLHIWRSDDYLYFVFVIDERNDRQPGPRGDGHDHVHGRWGLRQVPRPEHALSHVHQSQECVGEYGYLFLFVYYLQLQYLSVSYLFIHSFTYYSSIYTTNKLKKSLWIRCPATIKNITVSLVSIWTGHGIGAPERKVPPETGLTQDFPIILRNKYENVMY